MNWLEPPSVLAAFAFIWIAGWLLNRLLPYTPLVRAEAERGHAVSDGYLIAMALILAWISAQLLFTAGLQPGEFAGNAFARWTMMLMGLAALLLALLGACARYRWDNRGIEFGAWFLRTRLAWADVTDVRTWDKTRWRLRAGKRALHWSTRTLAWRAIKDAVAHHRPDLASAIDDQPSWDVE
ncbi:MAG: hypothetical protein AB7O98_13785 [Hyphomonadaceae bacterium]